MNQILLTNNNYNRKNKNNTNNIRKIIIFFGIFILIFAIAMIGVYSYKVYKNNNQRTEQASKPELSIEETEDQLTIIAKSELGISEIIYTWNDDDITRMDMNGRTSYEEIIYIPEGESTLNVKVVDLNGQEVEETQNFIREITEKPVIETEIQDDARLKITATVTDGMTMAYITYKWNEEEEVTVRAENETDTVIEAIIDVERGENILTITAVDSKGRAETISKKFNGVNNPIIEVTKNGGELNMKISHDMGFEKVEFYLNGQTYVYDESISGYDATKQELEYVFNLQEGENIIIIVATSTEGTQAVYQGKCDYTVE